MLARNPEVCSLPLRNGTISDLPVQKTYDTLRLPVQNYLVAEKCSKVQQNSSKLFLIACHVYFIAPFRHSLQKKIECNVSSLKNGKKNLGVHLPRLLSEKIRLGLRQIKIIRNIISSGACSRFFLLNFHNLKKTSCFPAPDSWAAIVNSCASGCCGF